MLLLILQPIFIPQIISNPDINGDGIIIAIVDSGVDYNHPALGGGIGADKIVIGGYDFVDNDSDPMDELGHGTHIAGIITNIAPGSKLLAYRVVDYNGLVQSSDVIRALELAVSDGADIINLSLGSMSESEELRKSIKQITNSGVIVVTAVGNNGPIFGSIGDPAKYEDVISVGSHYNYYGDSTLAVVQIDSIKEEIIGLPMIGSVFPVGTLYAELEYVNYARNEDLVDVNLTGKIAVAKRRGEPGEVVFFSEKEFNVAQKGAIGLVIINTLPGLIKGRLLHPSAAIGYIPSIPTILITQEDGEKILNQIDVSNTFVRFAFRNSNLTNFVSLFSSRGPISSFYIKPDLVSFGEQVNSTWLNNSYKHQNGTSFSAPQVTGTVALLLDLHGELDKNQVLGILAPSAIPLKNSYNVYWPSIIQGSGSLNIENALQSPMSIYPAQLSFNLADKQSTHTQFITIESLVSDPMEVSLEHNLQDQDLDVSFNSSNFVLSGTESVVIEVNNKLLNSIQESYTDEFRLTIKTNLSDIQFSLPVLTYFNTISIDIQKISESYIVDILGIEQYDKVLFHVYNKDTADFNEEVFSFDEEMNLKLSPGNYWIYVIISSNDNFEFGGIEYTVDQNSSISSSNYDYIILLISIIFFFSAIILLYYNRKQSS